MSSRGGSRDIVFLFNRRVAVEVAAKACDLARLEPTKDVYRVAVEVAAKACDLARLEPTKSHKEKRSAYAPEKGVRYDGIYRIEKCWRKPGIQGYKVCRYLFVRCDNDPAPWTSDENGDRPRPLPTIKELKDATDVTYRKSSPSWDYDLVGYGKSLHLEVENTQTVGMVRLAQLQRKSAGIHT